MEKGNKRVELCSYQMAKLSGWALYVTKECTWYVAELNDEIGKDWDVKNEWNLLGPTPKRFVSKDQLKFELDNLPIDINPQIADYLIEKILA